MQVTINSEPRECAEGMTLADLLCELGLDTTPCAAEINKRLIPKREHADRQLCEGDTIELVTLVGGG